MNIKHLLSFILTALYFYSSIAQAPKKPHIGEVLQQIDKLEVLGSVLYVAAHPDDENTSLITYYANEEHMRTAYLSATRGDGGQNLIGAEIREELGLIRTQELLAARRIDGGEQFFSRANDFGYSKHPDETFNIWNKDEVLEDFVWVFRKFKPDVVITRFSTVPGVTHGHHTASAMLAKEAFIMAGDPTAYPGQLEFVDVWQPKKLFWNTSWWFYRNTGQKMDTTGLTSINVGKYNPGLGKSYSEISSLSRSMHKSQGFGSTGRRGDAIEYLVQWEGAETKKPFDDIEVSWDRVNGSEEVKFLIKKLKEEFDPNRPSASLEVLVLLRKAISNIDDPFWKEIKTKEVDELIKAVSGLFVELVANQSSFVPGDSIQIALEAINRGETPMKLTELKLNHWFNPIELKNPLVENKKFATTINLVLPKNMEYATPYWLKEEATLGMYRVSDQLLRGHPENAPAITSEVGMEMGGEVVTFSVPVVFKKNDPVKGEVYEPISISPPVMANISGKVLVFGDETAKTVEVRVIAAKNNVEGALGLTIPKGWSVSPETQSFSLSQKGEEKIYSFQVTPPAKKSEGLLTVKLDYEGRVYNKGVTTISYDHIPKQKIYPVSEVRLIKLDLNKKGSLIGYIEGAGDAIPENLAQIGYRVDRLEKDRVTAENLSQYDAIILGVRAFNTVDWLAYKNEELFKYAEKGGTVIVQYNTSHRLVTKKIAPYDIQLSRDRVAVEEAPVEIIAQEHEVIKGPNKITLADFDDWAQERGLYFPNKWSGAFTPILSSHDPGETPKEGGLLIAKHGAGYYVYSGYSWFRNLPAGVPGAYRLFVNLISLGK